MGTELQPANLETIERIQQIIANSLQAIENTKQDPDPYSYANFSKGFVRYDGAQNRGSFVLEITTFKETIEFLSELSWQRMTPEEAAQDGDPAADGTISEYYRAKLPQGLNGFQGGTQWKNLSDEAKELVAEIQGRHGPELIIKGASITDFEKTDELRLIVSKKNHPYNKTGLDILATWFPGCLAPPGSFMSGRKTITKDERFVKLELG